MSSQEDCPITAKMQTEGRDSVFEMIFREHRESLLHLCLRLTGNQADAEDALQDAMTDVYNGLPGFEGRAEISTWMHRITIRAAMRVRSKQKRTRYEPWQDQPARPTANNPEDREQEKRVLAAVDRLPTDLRLVIHLFSLHGLPHGEVAAILGIPEGTVWSRLHRARLRLQELLA